VAFLVRTLVFSQIIAVICYEHHCVAAEWATERVSDQIPALLSGADLRLMNKSTVHDYSDILRPYFCMKKAKTNIVPHEWTARSSVWSILEMTPDRSGSCPTQPSRGAHYTLNSVLFWRLVDFAATRPVQARCFPDGAAEEPSIRTTPCGKEVR
jgi:hypothetical protein